MKLMHPGLSCLVEAALARSAQGNQHVSVLTNFNRDLTVANKLLHYLLGGLAVAASDTAGQREVAAQAEGAILLYPSGNAALLAERVNELLGKPDRLNKSTLDGKCYVYVGQE